MAVDAGNVNGEERLIGVLKLRSSKRKSTHILTVPKEVVKLLGITESPKVKVFLDQAKRRVIYELVD